MAADTGAINREVEEATSRLVIMATDKATMAEIGIMAAATAVAVETGSSILIMAEAEEAAMATGQTVTAVE